MQYLAENNNNTVQNTNVSIDLSINELVLFGFTRTLFALKIPKVYFQEVSGTKPCLRDV